MDISSNCRLHFMAMVFAKPAVIRGNNLWTFCKLIWPMNRHTFMSCFILLWVYRQFLGIHVIALPTFFRVDSGASVYLSHYNDIIMSAMAPQITSLTTVYLTVSSGADQINIKVPRHWPLCGNSPVTGEFPAKRASNAENVFIWWFE